VAVALALAGLGTWLAGGREVHVFVPNPVAGRKRGDLLSAGVYGVGYGLASLACTLPIFLIVVGAAFVQGTVLGGLALFLAYGAGMGAIVVAVTLGAALLKGIVARFLRMALPYVQRASGVLLILAGTYLAVRQLEEARLGTLSALQPYAAEIGVGLALATSVAAGLLWWLGRVSESAAADAEAGEQEAGDRELSSGAAREPALPRRSRPALARDSRQGTRSSVARSSERRSSSGAIRRQVHADSSQGLRESRRQEA